MVCVPTTIHFYVAGIVRKLTLILLAQYKCIPCFRKKSIEELDIARVEIMIEVVITGVMNDHHAPFFEQRFVSIEIEVITERHHLNEQGVENRIDVVGTDVRNAGN